MGMGERGLLQQFAAMLVARLKAWSFESPHNAEEEARYIREQKKAIGAALAGYHPHNSTNDPEPAPEYTYHRPRAPFASFPR